MSLVLQTFPASFGMPSASPFCVKVMCLLKMGGLEWRADDKADVRKAPKKKLPVLLDGETAIADSGAIATHLSAVHGCDFEEGLSAEQIAQGHVLIRMVEEHTYFALLADRWLVDRHWEKLRDAYFSDMPFGVRHIVPPFVRREIVRTCRGQGIARHDVREMAARVQKDLDALTITLGDRAYLFGDTPVSADASVAPALDSLLNPHFPDGILKHLRVALPLAAYVDRCRDSIFPTEDVYPWRNS